ncbi:MAG: copper resistance protein CopC, partial [Nocardioides sp.]
MLRWLVAASPDPTMTAAVSGRRRLTLRAWVAAGLTLLALSAGVAGAAPASAHATLLSSDPTEGAVLPEAPDVVTFVFDEPVSLPPNGVQVFDSAGSPVEADGSSRDTVITADLPDSLDDGSYVVVWRAISADGHPIAGSLTFAIGAPSAVVAAPRLPDVDPAGVRTVLSITQGLGYLGLLVAVGLVFFITWTARGVRLDSEVVDRLTRVRWSAAGLAGLASAFTIPLSGAYQQGLGLSQLGEAQAIDLALVGDDLVVFGLQVVGLSVAFATLHRPRVAAMAAAVAGISAVLVGHSRAIEPVWLLISTDVLHLAAGATWLGGLIGLALVLGQLSGRERDAALLLSRFSVLAATALGLLALTGTLMGAQILGGWSPLFGTDYGRLLLVKVAIAAVVAAVAGWNRFRLLPAVS